MANLGFVGLGVMGGEMVARLLDKGHTVTGYNRTKSKAQWLIDRGMRWGETPRKVAEAADMIFVVVTDSSTLSPATSREVAEKVRAKGADMVDAPVSGSVTTLESGKLSVMVGGRKATFDRIKPILDDI